jgi:hypothetical protein
MNMAVTEEGLTVVRSDRRGSRTTGKAALILEAPS